MCKCTLKFFIIQKIQEKFLSVDEVKNLTFVPRREGSETKSDCDAAEANFLCTGNIFSVRRK